MTLTLVLLALGVALIQWRAHQRETQALAAYPPSGQMIEVHGIPVHITVTGEGPDLVLLHGASGNLRDFTLNLTDRLKDHYRVIAFDRPGLGQTGRLPGKSGAWNSRSESPQEQAAFLQDAAQQLGVTNPIVLGHSYGGAVALAWGLMQPEETAALVLVSAVSEPWPGELGWVYRMSGSALGGALVVPVVTAFLPANAITASLTSIFAPQNVPDGYAAHIGPGLTLRREVTRANAQQVNSLRPHVVEMAAQYDLLQMPIELLHGTEDTIVPASVHAETFAKTQANAHLTLLPGAGHMPHHSDPDAILAAIARAAARAGLR